MELNSPDASRQALEQMAASFDSGADNGEQQAEAQTEETAQDQQEAQAAEGAEPQEQEQEQEQTEQAEDHGEKSRLGRKVKRIEEEVIPKLTSMEQAVARLDQFAQMLIQQAQTQQQQQAQGEEDEYIPTTKAEMRALYRKWQQEEQQSYHQSRQQYEQGYLKTLDSLRGENDDDLLHSEIVDLITTPGKPFNKKHSDNPQADAMFNYSRAMAHVVKERMAKPATPKNPLKGGDPKSPLGAASTGGGTAQKPVNLPPEARAFIMSRSNPNTGKPYTDEEIRKMVR